MSLTVLYTSAWMIIVLFVGFGNYIFASFTLISILIALPTQEYSALRILTNPS
jgi:hypothetical protein